MYGLVSAFQNVKIGDKFGQSEWVGLYHFKRLFRAYWFPITIKNTVVLSILQLLFSWPLALGLALLLHNSTNLRIKKFTQMVTYIPHMMSLVVVISILNIFCAGDSGLINIVRTLTGAERINFFGLPEWVNPLYIISGLWTSTGYSAIIYLGALSAVDDSQIEAAQIDGANRLRCIWHVQLPAILPTVATMLILNVGKMFSLGADKMLLMQTDLNLASSEILSTYVYKMGFGGGQYGFAAAAGLFQGIINLITFAIANAISKKLADVSVV